jgi:hypothetical protein
MSMNGKQIAHIASELAATWREENTTEAEAAMVLDRVATALEQRESMDESACLVLLSQLEVSTTVEFELIDELRLAIETRAWDRHPSRGGAAANAGRSVSATARS